MSNVIITNTIFMDLFFQVESFADKGGYGGPGGPGGSDGGVGAGAGAGGKGQQQCQFFFIR